MPRTAATSPRAIESTLLAITAVGVRFVPFASEFPLLGIYASLVLAIMAISWGLLARREIERGGGDLGGRGLAVLGGWAGGIVPLGSCLMPSTSFTRDAAIRSSHINNLKRIGLALQQYHQLHGRFPPAVVYDPAGRPLYSWRVLLLPFLEEQALYGQFRRDEAWDSPHNRRLLDRRPGPFHPVGRDVGDRSLTHWLAFVGPGTAFEDPRGQALDSFTDGKSQTLMIVTAAEPVPWTRPIDLAYSPVGLLPRLGHHYGYGGVNVGFVLMADASVRTVTTSMPEPILRALITRNGGESLGPGDY